MNKDNLFTQQHFTDSISDFVLAALIIVIGFLAIVVFRRVLLQRLRKFTAHTKNSLDDFVIDAVGKILMPFLYVAVVYTAIRTLNIPARYDRLIENIWLVIFTFFAIRLIASFAGYLLTGYVNKKYGQSDRSKEIKGLLIVINITFWAIGLVFLLDNLGYDVATVITGLGIGGIAVALAAQTVLGDLFSYFVIFFDRPFEVGDFIIVDDKMGTVETVGIKTTRVRSLGGEEIIFSNKNLTDSRVHNYKRMQRRRVVFSFGVEYNTPVALLETLPAIIRQTIENVGTTTFDRAHFVSFGESALNFEVVYYMETDDYNKYMDTQQSINLSLLRIFESKGIEFAHPVRSVYLHERTREMKQ